MQVLADYDDDDDDAKGWQIINAILYGGNTWWKQREYFSSYWGLHMFKRSLFFICLATPRDRKVTHNDSFGKLTPPAAHVFFGIWRKRQTTSSRFSLLASTGKARQARKSISAPSRNQIVSPPTAPIKVSSYEMVGCHHMPPASMAVNHKTRL